MIEAETHLRRMEAFRYSHFGRHRHSHLIDRLLCHSLSLLSRHSLTHKPAYHSLQHRVLHSCSDGITNRPRNRIAKIYRRIGAQILIRAKQTRNMLPTFAVLRAEHIFLCQRSHLLTLFQTQEIRCHVVLIHQHIVIQILITESSGK